MLTPAGHVFCTNLSRPCVAGPRSRPASTLRVQLHRVRASLVGQLDRRCAPSASSSASQPGKRFHSVLLVARLVQRIETRPPHERRGDHVDPRLLQRQQAVPRQELAVTASQFRVTCSSTVSDGVVQLEIEMQHARAHRLGRDRRDRGIHEPADRRAAFAATPSSNPSCSRE